MRVAILCNLVFLLGVGPTPLPIQSVTTSSGDDCFTIGVRLNGRPVEGPRSISLKSKNAESVAHLDGGCFRVPAKLKNAEALDVVFIVPGNRIYLPSVSTSLFSGAWDVDLADKHFGKGVNVPKGAHVKEACSIVFH